MKPYTEALIGPFLIMCAMLVRLPYFFTPVIDWDESTYILMGREILDGRLPYVTLWENKPPLGFAVYALLMALGKTIPGIRLLGACYIGVAGIVVYWAGRAIYGRAVAFFAGLLTVLYAGMSSSGECIMMEHICLLPLAVVAMLFLKTTWGIKDCIAVGLSIGCAMLMRTNLILLLPAACISWLMQPHGAQSMRSRRRQLVALVISAAAPLLAIMLLYAPSGHLTLLLRSVFLAPLDFMYNDAIRNKEQDWSNPLYNTFNIVRQVFFSGNAFLLMLAAVGIARECVADNAQMRSTLGRIIVPVIAVGISIVATGGRYEHYLIQLVPWLALACAGTVEALFRSPYRIGGAIAVLVLLCPSATDLQNYRRFTAQAQTGNLHSDEISRTAAYIVSQGVTDKYIFSCETQILYFLTKTRVPVLFAHSENNFKMFLTRFLFGRDESPQQMMSHMFDKQPVFFISAANNDSCLSFLDRTRYVLDRTIGPYSIYKLRR